MGHKNMTFEPILEIKQEQNNYHVIEMRQGPFWSLRVRVIHQLHVCACVMVNSRVLVGMRMGVGEGMIHQLFVCVCLTMHSIFVLREAMCILKSE
jgi:hypothetical protein